MRRDISRNGRAVRLLEIPSSRVDTMADRTSAIRGQCWGASLGEKTEDLADFAGLLRSSDRRYVVKAALEAWGADSKLFHQGAAKETCDPGVILKRLVGSDGSFSEHAELPTDLGGRGRL
jgi:hypothetical protein